MSEDQQITITRWKPMDKGPLKGFFEFEKQGFFFADCSFFVSDKGQKWISLPSREYQDNEGKRKFFKLCGFRDAAKHTTFTNKIMEALEKYLAKPAEPKGNNLDDMPF